MLICREHEIKAGLMMVKKGILTLLRKIEIKYIVQIIVVICGLLTGCGAANGLSSAEKDIKNANLTVSESSGVSAMSDSTISEPDSSEMASAESSASAGDDIQVF